MRKLIITIVVIALVVFVAYVIKESIETKSLDGYYAEAFDSPLRVRDPKLVRVSGLEEYKVVTAMFYKKGTYNMHNVMAYTDGTRYYFKMTDIKKLVDYDRP